MPVNDRYPLEEVLAECKRRYFDLRGRKVFIEYVMLAGVNDRVEQAKELATLLDPKIFKVNLIPYNPTGMYDGSTPKAIGAFKSVLERAHPDDGAPDARTGHRRGLRAAGGDAMSDGYFADDSVIRRIGNRSVLMLGGPRALLLQAAHPLVAAGIVGHSRFAAEPWARLARTMTALYTIVFGTREEADRVGAIVQHVHGHVHGELGEDVGVFPAGMRTPPTIPR